MMKSFRLLLLALLLPTSASAWPKHGAPTGAQGLSQINISSSSSAPAMVDVLKSFNVSFAGGATPGGASVDNNGYPTANTFTGTMTLTGVTNGGFVLGDYFWQWDAGTKLKFTTSASSACVVISGTAGSCSTAGSNATITIDGTGAGVIKMTFTAQPSFGFSNTFNFSGGSTNNLALVANQDYATYTTYRGTGDAREFFTANYLTYMGGLKAATLRTMGDINTSGSGNANLDSLWAYRTTKTMMPWSANQLYPPGVWSGGHGTAGTISYSNVASSGCIATGGSNELYTASATDDQPAPNLQSLISAGNMGSQGIVIQGVAASANATTSPKLCFGSNAFPIYDMNAGSSIGAGAIAASSIATFIFMPALNAGNGAFLYAHGGGGLVASVPYEAQIALANYLNKNWWPTIPMYATDSYVTQLATLTLGSLNSALFWYPEYTNEMWNNTFWSTKYGDAMAAALGSGLTGTRNDFYALRVRQIMGALIPAVYGGNISRVRRVLAYQGGATQALASSTTYQNRLLSIDLSPSIAAGQGYCLFTGGSWSGSCTGGGNYTASPNRAVDVVDAIAFAPYAGGSILFGGGDNCLNCVPVSGMTSQMQAIVDAWDAGSSSSAIALVDADIRTGSINPNGGTLQTISASGTTFQTPVAHNFIVGAQIIFPVTGGTTYSGLVSNALYKVTAVGNVGCTGCSFTIQAFIQGAARGASVDAGTVGSGTVSVGWVGGETVAACPTGCNSTTLLVLNSTMYPFAETMAEQFDGARPAGMVNLRTEQYEGNLEPVGPTAAQCAAIGVTSTSPTTSFSGTTANASTSVTGVTNIGSLVAGMGLSGTNIPGGTTISTVRPDTSTLIMSASATGTNSGLTATGNCGTSIALALQAWKNSTSASTTQALYYNQFRGFDSSMPTYRYNTGLAGTPTTRLGQPSQLVIGGGLNNPNNAANNNYGLLNGAFYGVSTPFKLYDGIAAYNN